MKNTKLQKEIINILDCLKDKSEFLSRGDNYVSFNVDANNPITISEDGIFLKEVDLSNKIFSSDDQNESYVLDYGNFFNKISDSIIRVDHVGINYSCENIERELEFYGDLIKDTNLQLVEEENPDGGSRWFFLKNRGNEDAPMFEIVLWESKTKLINQWSPHFQIDIDTSLTIEDLREITNKYLASGFIKWELDIPNVGVVLAMGALGQFGSTKIYIGIGTNKRNNEVRGNSFEEITL